MSAVRVLIIDNDEATSRTVAWVLGGEGWLIDVVACPEEAFQRLRRGGWHLVVADFTTCGASEQLFEFLKELAVAGGPVRVLFLVPALIAYCARPQLEALQVPYAIIPLRLADFLEQVSDLLIEAGAIRHPLCRVRELAHEYSPPACRRVHTDSGSAMFASRDGYFDYDEEELRRFEEEEKKKKLQKEEVR